MFSSIQAEFTHQENKETNNLSFTTHSSHSHSAQGSSSTEIQNKIDWHNVEESLMTWFNHNQILKGDLDQLIQGQKKNKGRKIASLNTIKDDAHDPNSILARRLGRKLTISI